jgi:hypothetical protein
MITGQAVHEHMCRAQRNIYSYKSHVKIRKISKQKSNHPSKVNKQRLKQNENKKTKRNH